MNDPLQQRSTIRTTCPYCGVGCGLLAKPDGRGGAVIAGDPAHPANFGNTCSKGSALGETLGLGTRLLHPMMRGNDGTMQRSTWDAALGRVAEGFSDIIDRHGPDAVAFYLSGQLLTEDYYVANKLMKGFIGSANIDTNSRLCMASSVAGHRRAFGSDTVPGSYADLDEADLIILVGSNTAWCHPVLFQRMVRNRTERGATIVVIDPRRTATAADADLFLPIAPGMDAVLFSGLLVHLAERNALDESFIRSHCAGFDAALASAKSLSPDIESTAVATGIDAGLVRALFERFRKTPRSVTCYSQGVNQSAQGTDKVNAIINCHLATGRIGKPGCGPFSLTGQPNAMGGREVGGLANMLAAHMGFSPEEVDRVRRFWRAPLMAQHEGLKAVPMFEAISRGEIKALWVMATNPAVSLPRAGSVREALGKLELLVVSDNVMSNDTINGGAHVLLPAAAWGEKDGTVTNSERRITRQRAFLPLPAEARPDWQITAEVGRRLGFTAAFAYHSAADIFREHAALSAFENGGTRDFDIGALASLTDHAYDALEPVQWPLPAGLPPRERRFFGKGNFFTADRKARFIATARPALQQATSPRFPLRLNTGRVRDQWHTMTRTGLSARLAMHLPEPFVEVHPDDAAHINLTDGGYAQVTTAHGACVVRVVVTNDQQPGSLFMPIHWSDATASQARAGDLVASCVDPVSGQPEAKATPAAIAPVNFAMHGFIRSRQAVALPPATWWVRIATRDGYEYRIAADHGAMIWHDFAHQMTGLDTTLAERLDQRIYRAATIADGEIEGLICIGPAGQPATWSGLADLDMPDAATPLAQVRSMAFTDTATVICACHGISETEIRAVFETNEASTTADIAQATGAGSNCGSCLPEIKRMVAMARAQQRAIPTAP